MELSESLEALVEQTLPSVVGVRHERGQGSGVIVAPDGYVVTNSHVLRGARELKLRLDPGEELRGEIIGDDPPSDLAVVRVFGHGLPSLPLSEERRLRVGQLVVAIGNPLRFERSVSLGVVSAIDRTLAGPEATLEGLLQTDAAINPGSSGGPLLDAAGSVVGITTAVVAMASSIGFAIPAHTAGWVVPVLLRHGRIERPLMRMAAHGVELSRAQARELGQPRAVRVLDVSHDGPAARAGLRRDDLILSASDHEVGRVDDLVRSMVLGEARELSLVVQRGDRRLTRAVLPERPRPRRLASTITAA
jgi:S1-C subfamily serine protease